MRLNCKAKSRLNFLNANTYLAMKKATKFLQLCGLRISKKINRCKNNQVKKFRGLIQILSKMFKSQKFAKSKNKKINN